jgi:FdhE protein
MPLLPALSPERDPAWQAVLHHLLDGVEAAGAVTATLGKVLDGMRAKSAEELDTQADAVLARRYAEIEPATAPFTMAALQVVWTDLASRLDPRDIPYLDTPGVCPACGGQPVASIVRVGGQYQATGTCNAACVRANGTWSARSARIAIRPKASRITASKAATKR